MQADDDRFRRLIGADDLGIDPYLRVMRSDTAYLAGSTTPVLGIGNSGQTRSGLHFVGQPAAAPIDFAKAYITTAEYLAVPLEGADRLSLIEGIRESIQRCAPKRDVTATLVGLRRLLNNAAAVADLALAVAQALPPHDALRFVHAMREDHALLARQLILAALRAAILVPDHEHVAGGVPWHSAVIITHIEGELLHSEDDEGPTLGGLPERLAIELLQNQYFNTTPDVYALIQRSAALWDNDDPDIIALCGDRTPAQLVFDATGLKVADFLALGFALLAFEVTWKPSEPSLVRLDLGSRMPPDVIEAFWTQVAATPSEMADQLAASSHTAWNFLAFQRRPCLRFEDDILVLDQTFLFERVSNGLYWAVHDYLKSSFGETRRLQWTQAWGAIVERTIEGQLFLFPPPSLGHDRLVYTEEDLQQAYPGSKNADVVIDCGNTWLLCEVVSGQLTVDTRVTGDRTRLLADFEKLVFKKIRQIDATALNIFRDPAALLGVSLPARPVIPVVIAASGFPVNPISLAIIMEWCASEGVLNDARIRPLCVIDSDEVDMLEALRDAGHNPADVLTDWQQSSLATVSLKNFLIAQHPSASMRSGRIQDATERLLAGLFARLGVTNGDTPATSA